MAELDKKEKEKKQESESILPAILETTVDIALDVIEPVSEVGGAIIEVGAEIIGSILNA